MALVDNCGNLISYNCSDLIYELKKDIAEFGDNLMVNVVKERRNGIDIYKEYMISKIDFNLLENESLDFTVCNFV